ncbi:MAG: N-acetylmuramoyl-L-alanine amidase [Anaerolineae bacterium]
MAMLLSQYPRPPKDTGWGFHDSAGADSRPANPAAYARYLRQDLGITWFKALVMATNKVDLVRAFTEAGIEVIVRLYTPQPHPGYVVSASDVRAYVQAGAHYIEWGNEPNLVLEWNRASWNEGARVDKVCLQYLRNADVIRQAGGIPLFPALSPGGDYPHRDWYRTTFEWFRLNGKLSALDGAALAIHNRPLNRPLSVVESTGCNYLEYEWIDNLVNSYMGRSLPLLGTEAGYEPSWNQDPTYPAIDVQRHATYNVEILRNFGPYGSRRWRDCLFCQCMWLVDNFGHRDFGEAAWHNNSRYGGGGNLPAVAALRSEWQARPFQRTPTWQTGKPDYVKATWKGSPNSDARPSGVKPGMVVLYSTGADFNAVVQKLQNPASQVSYHYLVSRSGAIYQFVAEAQRAWHAGNSLWNGKRVNDYAVAVGLVNRNDGSEGYPGAQLDEAAALVRYLAQKYTIPLDAVITAAMLSGSAMPGFDLPAFRQRVSGTQPVWPPDEIVRNAAWNAGGIAYNPDAAFPRFARQQNLGNPETAEFDFELDGKLYRGQGFSAGIVFAEIGHWNDIQFRSW